ncbi:MAG: glycosyl transferase family protein [Sphingomonadales bacterium]|nr:glycosyl transferase family protein [Sphingomonadales bacterium]
MAWAESGVDPMLRVLVPVERELLVFAAFWFVVGLFDEFAIDCTWLWLRLTRRARTARLPQGYGAAELTGPTAVLIPAFQEASVIATTIGHMLRVWPQRELRLYVGCYANDAATLAAAMDGSAGDSRVRIVVHAAHGPTTKADCLNRLYAALCMDEARSRQPFRAVILHDAEDMVHPAALQAIDAALGSHDFVQIPVRPALQADSRWIAGHYADEFAEAHAKALVVRSAVGAAIPAAGVGCGFSRAALARLAELHGSGRQAGPFATDCLTEDYELGLTLSREGRGSTFLRLRDSAGVLVATSSYFPSALATAVRQKTRWVHGIAFQAWDRMGWSARPLELWMALRDRRGPLTALVLFAAYLLLVVDTVLSAARQTGWRGGAPLGTAIGAMLLLSLAGFVWRSAVRATFTAHEYGWQEGLRSILRIPVGNIVAIMAGRRALAAYVRSLAGQPVVWDKTAHSSHPAEAAPPSSVPLATLEVQA